MKKSLFFLLLLVLVYARTNAQVNLQTGSAEFNLPLFSWQDDKSRLNSAIALDYNSGQGLKVSDIASNVGQGWNLISGGFVTRIQVGEPDDQKPYATGTGNNAGDNVTDLKKYPPGYLYNSTSAARGCPTALAHYPIFDSKDQLYTPPNGLAADRELDYFAFQFNGRTGQFILNKAQDNAAGDVGIPLDDSKLKIWFTRNESMSDIRTTIDAFYIQDENGLIYKFQNLVLTKVLNPRYCDRSFSKVLNQPVFGSGGTYYQADFDLNNFTKNYVVSGWYLTEIRDSFTNRKITYTYSDPFTTVCNQGYGITYNSNKNYVVISKRISISRQPRLLSISYPDGHSVNFDYGSDRADLPNDKALASVSIQYQGRYVSQYLFNTSYFIQNRYGIPEGDAQKSIARLCLLSVKKYGPDLKEDEPPYRFDYNMGTANDDEVPGPFSYSKDIWGYYNGSAALSSDGTSIPVNLFITSLSFNQLRGLCFIQNNPPAAVQTNYATVNPGFAQNGLLKKIFYPTGGTLSYTYAQNVGTIDGTVHNATVGGVHVAATSTTDGGYQYDCDNPPMVTHYNYVDASGNASLWGVESPNTSITSSSYYAPEKLSFHYHFPFHFFCSWDYEYPGLVQPSDEVPLSTLQNILETIAPALSILSDVTLVLDIVKVATGGSPVGLIIDVVAAVLDIVLTCFGSTPTQSNVATTYYSDNLGASNPLPIQFNRVEVVQGDGGAGRVVSEFTDPSDYPLWQPHNNALSMQQRYAYWAYGLLKRQGVYDASGNLVKETLNSYDTSAVLQNLGKTIVEGNPDYNNSHVSCKCFVTDYSSQRISDWNNPGIYNNNFATANNSQMQVQPYQVNFGRMQLSSTKERVYQQGTTHYLENSTSYSYNPVNHQPSAVTRSKSDGNSFQVTYTYSCDYTGTSAGILNTFNQNNMLSIPVATRLFAINNTSHTGSLLNEKVTEYATVATGEIKPYRTLEQRFNQPANGAGMYSGPGSSITQYKQVQTFAYDNSGNLTGVKDEGNRNVTSIYDYNDKFVAASVINADPAHDYSYYTSFETNDRGGWTFIGPTTYITTSAITGTRCLALSTGTVLQADILNMSKAYILSFWAATAAAIHVNAGTLITSAPTINGFTYYEYAVPQGTSILSVSGTGNIDELRLYPQDARMRTVTYDPIIGKTSECDENNRITYYGYDNLGRLSFVKDEDGNIVKMYEYSVATPACPVTYYNRAITEHFTKSNCGAGFAGGDVTYTVPANKYASQESQADADAQAENEINANGQAEADASNACLPVYTNVAVTLSGTAQCGEGYVGSVVAYTVPAGTYTSTISQADADAQAEQDAKANVMVYASANGSCTLSTTADWAGGDTTQYACQVDASGNKTGHTLAYLTDVNPYSPTYQQWQWIDIGSNPPPGVLSCTDAGISTDVYAKIIYDETYEGYLHFYSDSACTIEIPYPNLTLNSDVIEICPPGIVTEDSTSYHVVIGPGIITSLTFGGRYDPDTQCIIEGHLLPGTGYIVVN